MAENKMQWYVLRAVSGKEAKVKEYIDAEIKNGSFGGFVREVLIPTEKVLQLKNGKRVEKSRNFLPGYVFVEAQLVGEIAHTLRQTPNCLGFLGGLDNPTPLREREVDRIKGKVEEPLEEEFEGFVPFTEGEKVKVIDGPFSGFTGEVEEVNAEKKNVTVTVVLFGRNTPVVLGYAQVEKSSE